MYSKGLQRLAPADSMAALNDTAQKFAGGASLPELIFAQAARRPEAWAVDDGRRRVSYAELQARAGAVAARLAQMGVAPGDRVGVCLTRSTETVAALLGVMAAGAAYVPLDPGYPYHRLAAMTEDAGCAVILVEAETAARAPAGPAHLPMEALAPGELASRAAPHGLAYVIYTSGSTGRPKGVEVRHAGVVNLLHAFQRRLDFQPGDRWLAVTTISFDISVLEIFLPLVCGGCAVLGDGGDGVALARRIAEVRPKVLQATPATWRLLLAAGWAGEDGATLLCGGEAVDPALARWLLERGGGRFWNVYGPTETTIWSTASEVRAVDGRVPIGRPLDNTRLYILDDRGEPVEPGEAGELYIAGAGVARGYLGQQELTAARFLPEPGRSGLRMYRTGDRVRLRPDGEVEYLGRLDHQVKVRGFRVEPEEVEARLCEHPQVAAAAVAAQPGPDGDSHLAAFVVGRDRDPDPSDLHAFVARALPPHLTPDLILPVADLPLTPNGKLDRRALAAWAPEVSGHGRADPARDRVERALARIFEAVLGARYVGLHDDFFALGGTSLGAVKVVSQIERRLGQRLHVNTLYHAGATVAALARVLRGEPCEALPHLVPLGGAVDDGRADPVFCLHTMVEGTLFFYDALARRLNGRERLLGVLPRGLHDGGEADADLSDMAAHVAAVLRARQPRGPYRLMGFSSAGTLAMETARRMRADGEAVSFLGLLDAYPPVGRRTWRYSLAVQSDRLERAGFGLANRLGRLLHRGGGAASDGALRLRHRLAVRRYRATPYAGEAALFVSRETARMFREPGLGWRRLVQRGLSVDVLEGGHYSLVNEPHVGVLAERVLARLDPAG